MLPPRCADDEIGARDRVGEALTCVGAHLLDPMQQHDADRDGEQLVYLGEQRRQNPNTSGARPWLDLQAHKNLFSTRSQRDCGLLGMPMMMSAALMAWRALLKTRSFPSRATGLIGFIMCQPGSAFRQTNHPSRIHERSLLRCQPSVIMTATNL
jgi:hypothetical protein